MKRLIAILLCAAMLGVCTSAAAGTIKNRVFIDASFKGVKVIRVFQSALDVQITPGTSDQTAVKCFVEEMIVRPDDYRIAARQKGDVLEIYQEPTRGSLSVTRKKGGYIHISAPAGVRVITVGTSSGDVAVSGFSLDSLRLSCSSGDIVAENVSAGKLALLASSGDITLKSGRGSAAEITTSSGDVRALGADFAKLSVRTSSGGQTVQNVPKAQQASFSCVSGDVNLSGVKASDKLLVRTSSGDATVSDCAGGKEAGISSVSGDVTASKVSADKFSVRTSSGNLSVKDIQGSQMDLSTVSGEGIVRLADAQQVRLASSSGDWTAYLGPRLKKVEFSTVSGAVKLFLKGNLKENRYSITGVSSTIEVVGLSRAERSLELNPGKALVDVQGRTSSGNVRIANY